MSKEYNEHSCGIKPKKKSALSHELYFARGSRMLTKASLARHMPFPQALIEMAFLPMVWFSLLIYKILYILAS